MSFCAATLTANVGTNSLRKLRYRLPSGWEIGSACFVGYSWPRRLRETATARLFESTCDPDRVFNRYSRLSGQRQAQGNVFYEPVANEQY